LKALVKAVGQTGKKAVSILALKTGVKLSSVTEAEMNNLGWYRKDGE
jgi:hypothetical protein